MREPRTFVKSRAGPPAFVTRSVISADVARLLARTQETGWVTEDAEAHLGPSIQAVAESLAVDLARMEVLDDILEVDIRLPEGSGATAQNAVAYAIIGSFAEMTTHIRQQGPMPDRVDLLVVTGMLPEDGVFATHGHLVRVRVLVGD